MHILEKLGFKMIRFTDSYRIKMYINNLLFIASSAEKTKLETLVFKIVCSFNSRNKNYIKNCFLLKQKRILNGCIQSQMHGVTK